MNTVRVLAAILGLTWLAPSQAAPPPFEFGVCIHLALGRSNANTVQRTMDGAGFTSFRDDVYWNRWEEKRGELHFPDAFLPIKQVADGLAQRGNSPLLILDFGNTFYDNGGQITSPEGIEAFSRYAEFAVRTFGESVNRYEVWNEWNTGFGSRPKVTYGDPTAYVNLLASTSAAVKRANPLATVVGGATAGIDLKWIRQFIAAGGLKHLDAFSVHSYTLYQYRNNPEGAIFGLDKLRGILAAASPQREIPVYVTEMGWPTNKGKFGVAEQDAAKYLVRFMMLARSRPWLKGVWWYDLIDDGDSDTASEQRFGLVRRNIQPKPAYLAAQRISSLLLVDSPIQSSRAKSGAYFVSGIDKNGRWAMAWTIEKNFMDWVEGVTAEPAAPAAFEALSTQLPADGTPQLFRQNGGVWQLDSSWPREVFAPIPSPPDNLKIQK
jgi:hypothetical protein